MGKYAKLKYLNVFWTGHAWSKLAAKYEPWALNYKLSG